MAKQSNYALDVPTGYAEEWLEGVEHPACLTWPGYVKSNI